MAPVGPSSAATSVLLGASRSSATLQAPLVTYAAAGLKLVEFDKRGHGYIATRRIKRGELLLEERPFAWSCGADAERPDLGPGVEWLLRTGAVHELPGPAEEELLTPEERAERVAACCAFRTAAPCGDGHYVGMLFRASSRFNHSCYPNAGGYMPSGQRFDDVAACASTATLRTFAIEEVSKGEELCISYLGEEDELSPSDSRQEVLQRGWGFLCTCDRCRNQRPLDSRLRGAKMDDFENEVAYRRAIRKSNQEYRALFDPLSEEYTPPPSDDVAAVLERLVGFRERHKFLDSANMVMQRVRNEILAVLLSGGDDGEACRKSASMVITLILEHMQVQNSLLPCLSPLKAPVYARFHRVLRHVPLEQAIWFEREAKVDNCDQLHRSALFLHDPAEFGRLELAPARNLPPLPKPGPPPRLGPRPSLGACCGIALGPPPASRPSVREGGARCARWVRMGRLQRRRRSARWGSNEAPQVEEMPVLLDTALAPEAGGKEAESKQPSLWDAYAEYGRPSAAARRVRGGQGGGAAAKAKSAGGSWFKFSR